MGQNLDCGVLKSTSIPSTLPITKKHIPFTKLPNKANFNYISPVTFHEDIPTLPSINDL